MEPIGNRRTTKIIGFKNKESNLIEDNDPTFKNEYPINKTELRDQNYSNMNSLYSVQFPDSNQIPSYFDRQINDY